MQNGKVYYVFFVPFTSAVDSYLLCSKHFMLEILPVMLALCFMLFYAYCAPNISTSLPSKGVQRKYKQRKNDRLIINFFDER